MKRRIVSFVLIISILSGLFASLPLTVSAATYSGTCGDNLTWILDTETGVLKISGIGNMDDWNQYGTPWYSYSSYIKSVDIGSGVTSIGNYAFYYCSNLTSVDILDSVTIIGNAAFARCSSLTSVIIPDSVTIIRNDAFGYCSSLTSIIIPDSVTSIGHRAFYSCSSLTSIDISNSITSIGVSMFNGCSSLTSVDIPDSVTRIYDNAFESCSSLTSVDIPTSVTSISSKAFANCGKLTSIYIPHSVTKIYHSAFLACNSLTSITVDEANENYSSNVYGVLFDKNKNTLIQYPIGKTRAEYVIPDSVTSIEYYAFAFCSNLTSVIIPDGVTSIGTGVFSACNNLMGIIIPDGVSFIGSSAFSNCVGLTSIDIPDSVTSISGAAFVDCDNLKDVYYSGSETEWGRISIGTSNECLTNANIHYNYNAHERIKLSTSSVSAYKYTCQTISVNKGDGVTSYDKPFKIKVTPKNSKVVSTSVDGNEITFSFNSVGTATITVSATDGSGAVATCDITVTEPERTEDSYLLERLALCQLVYSDDERRTNDLIVGKTVGDESQLANKNKPMFYFSDGTEISWDVFYRRYIYDYTVKNLSDELPGGSREGFYAAAFESPEGDIVIAYRGSEGGDALDMFRIGEGRTQETIDWWGTNFPMTFGLGLSSQFSQALDFYDSVKNDEENAGKKITVTGHSLGGALASYVALNRMVKCDNVNGATGWLFNHNFLANPKDYPIEFVGIGDEYVNENFNGNSDFINSAVVRWGKLGEFNYNNYADTINYNKKGEHYDAPPVSNSSEFIEIVARDYHSISSIINYNDGKFTLTEKTKEYKVENAIMKGSHFLGTTQDDNYFIPVMNSEFSSSSGCYALMGNGDDNVILSEGGNDTLIGNAGNDTLNGGAGNDTYVYGGDFGNDTIIDPSGADKIVFTDRTLSELTISENKITCGSNTIEISKQTRRSADFVVVDKDNKEKIIEFPKMCTFSLMRAVDVNATKGVQVFGNATVEIYDASEELIDTLSINDDTEVGVEYADYGMVSYSPQAVGLTLPAEGYIVKIKSDGSVDVWTVSDADNPTVAKQTYASQCDLSDGSVIVVNTGEMTEEQLSVKLINGETEEIIYSEAPEDLAISGDKNEIKVGEAITLSVPDVFADSVVWEPVNGNVVLTKNEDLTVTVTGYTAGNETVKAYLPNDELYSVAFSLEITEDAAPEVVVTIGEEIYDGTMIATDNVVFDVVIPDGYDKIVFDTSSPYSQIEDTNAFVINSVGVHNVNIYCENSETGARTKAFTFEFTQDGVAPVISGVENDAVYYTDRIINVIDDSVGIILVNGDAFEEETFILSEVGTYEITVTDTAGNETTVLFEIKAMPKAEDLEKSDEETIAKIRRDFEAVKYSLAEERMDELEEEITLLEETLCELLKMRTVTFNPRGGTTPTATKVVMFDSTYGELPTPTRYGYDFDGWYTSATGGTKVTNTTKVTVTGDQTLYAHWTEKPVDPGVSTTPSRLVAFIGKGNEGYFTIYNDDSANTYYNEYVSSNKVTELTAVAYEGYVPAYWVRFTQDSLTEVLVSVGAKANVYPLGGNVYYQPVFKVDGETVSLYIDETTKEILSVGEVPEDYEIVVNETLSTEIVTVYDCSKVQIPDESNLFTAYDINGEVIEEAQTPAFGDNIIITKTATNQNPLWTVKLGENEFTASYKSKFSFNYMFKAGTEVEVYENTLESEAVPTVSTIASWTEGNITRFTGLYALPEGYTLVNHGVMMSQNIFHIQNLEDNDTGELNITATTIIGRVSDNTENATPLFTIAKRLSDLDEVWYGRAFLVYTDGVNTYVKYSNGPVSTTGNIVEGDLPGNQEIYNPMYWDDSIVFGK